MCREKLFCMFKVSSSQLAQNVGVGSCGFQLLRSIRGSHDGPIVYVPGTVEFHFLGVALRCIGAGGAMRTRSKPCVVKTVIDGRSVQLLPQICILPTCCWAAITSSIPQASVPLADHAAPISRIAKQARQRGPILLDHGITLCTEQHPVLQAIPPWVSAGEKSVTSSRASRRWSMCVAETNTHLGQSFHARRIDLIPVGIPS